MSLVSTARCRPVLDAPGVEVVATDLEELPLLLLKAPRDLGCHGSFVEGFELYYLLYIDLYSDKD